MDQMISFGPPKNQDIPAVARLISLAFAGTLEGSTKWVTENGLENIRVLREGRAIPACLRRIRMGQYFGGRSVPLVGIAGVATAPEMRGKGHARQMMEACVREMHEDGVAIGGLYASTQALYRQSGFEQAGHRFITRIPIARLQVKRGVRRVVALQDSDHERVAACYRIFARNYNGMLDRGEYIWKRIREMRDAKFQGYGVLSEKGVLEGYLYLTQQRVDTTGRHDIHLSDLAFLNADGARQLLAFLADYEPMGDVVQLGGGPLHPLLTLLPQQRYEVKLKDYWMLRVVDVKKALEARGYSKAVRGNVAVEIRDDVIASNRGTWRVEFDAGRARVSKSKDGRAGRVKAGNISCDVRALAAMYSGLYSPRQAKGLAMCDGDEAGLDVLGAAFAGGTPWMTDHY